MPAVAARTLSFSQEGKASRKTARTVEGNRAFGEGSFQRQLAIPDARHRPAVGGDEQVDLETGVGDAQRHAGAVADDPAPTLRLALVGEREADHSARSRDAVEVDPFVQVPH